MLALVFLIELKLAFTLALLRLQPAGLALRPEHLGGLCLSHGALKRQEMELKRIHYALFV